MQHPYDVLRPEYVRDLAVAQILPRYERQCEIARDKILAQLSIYQPVFERTGVPVLVQGALSYRESDCDPTRSIAQGDRWDRVSVNVPRGRGPFKNKVDADVDGLHLDHLDAVAAMSGGWDAPRALYESELWNGFGPRNKGKRSGYVVAGTQLYAGGMYVRDGVWSASAEDSRPGTLAIMVVTARARPDLALPSLLSTEPAPTPPVAPQPPAPTPPGLGENDETTAALQTRLNELGQDPPLRVDGNYGRQTRRAVEAFQEKNGLITDGIAGPQTWAKLGTLP